MSLPSEMVYFYKLDKDKKIYNLGINKIGILTDNDSVS